MLRAMFARWWAPTCRLCGTQVADAAVPYCTEAHRTEFEAVNAW